MDADAVVRGLIRDRAKILGYIWAIVRDHHLVDDVFQEVMVLAVERAGEINGEDHLLLWARKVARFKSLEALRKNTFRTMSLTEDVVETLESEWSWADALLVAEQVNYLRRCMELLTPHARRIVHLRYTEGLSGLRVAELMQVKVRSIYVALARVHKTLGDCIRHQRHAAEVTHDG